LKSVLREKGYSTAVGDEGGFAPDLSSNREAIRVIMEAIDRAGYKPGDDIALALDPAASSFYEGEKYLLRAEAIIEKTTEEIIEFYESLVRDFPIYSIEDGLAEDDWQGWKLLTQRLGERIQLVGDDIFVTNTQRFKKGIEMGVANSILIKPNQIGTLTETIQAIQMAKKNDYAAVISHRSGETEDTFIGNYSGCPTLSGGYRSKNKMGSSTRRNFSHGKVR